MATSPLGGVRGGKSAYSAHCKHLLNTNDVTSMPHSQHGTKFRASKRSQQPRGFISSFVVFCIGSPPILGGVRGGKSAYSAHCKHLLNTNDVTSVHSQHGTKFRASKRDGIAQRQIKNPAALHYGASDI
jgi:adenosyl cobinamide kinase/adenosyl cobinamide phosphate guanylyltransferase